MFSSSTCDCNTTASTSTGYDNNYYTSYADYCRAQNYTETRIDIYKLMKESAKLNKEYKQILRGYYNRLLYELSFYYKPKIMEYYFRFVILIRKSFMKLRTFKNLRFK